jgi:hypothetical protein
MNIPFYHEKVAGKFSYYEDHFYKGIQSNIRNNTVMSKSIEKNCNIDKCIKLIGGDMNDSPEFLLIKKGG